MSVLAKILLTLVALEFFYIMYLETFATASTSTAWVFNLDIKTLRENPVNNLFKNQGIYNDLMGLGLLYAAYFSANGLKIGRLILGYIILVALYGSVTSDKKIILT